MSAKEKKRLARIYGETSHTQGVGWSRSSGRIARARAAGIKTIIEPSAEILQLAQELEEANRILPLSKHAKTLLKYDISGGVAHVTPEMFCDIMKQTSYREDVRAAGVEKIEIRQDINGYFEFIDPAALTPATVQSMPQVSAKNFYMNGIAAATKGHRAVLVHNNKGIVGIFYTSAVPQDLNAHAKNSQALWEKPKAAQNAIYAPDDSFSKIFRNAGSLIRFMELVRQSEAPAITLSFKDSDDQNTKLVLGTLHHPDVLNAKMRKTFPQTTIPQLHRLCKAAFLQPPDLRMATIFSKAAGHIVIENSLYTTTLAVLTHPDHTLL